MIMVIEVKRSYILFTLLLQVKKMRKKRKKRRKDRPIMKRMELNFTKTLERAAFFVCFPLPSAMVVML